ncbi:hypothetical protein MPSEU_000066500 [Mayamaea pseudoterrestris]|nr:hypothetical protein MPSEU_000066500 [Mayamaea pseudoterrestris]
MRLRSLCVIGACWRLPKATSTENATRTKRNLQHFPYMQLNDANFPRFQPDADMDDANLDVKQRKYDKALGSINPDGDIVYASFFAPKPRDILQGVLGSLRNVVLGSFMCLAVFGASIYLAFIGKGFFWGLISILVGSVISVGVAAYTVLQILYQLLVGLYKTPSSVKAWRNGEVWHPEQRVWTNYTLAEEKQELKQREKPYLYVPINQTYYAMLGVPFGATALEVGKAYDILAKKLKDDNIDDVTAHSKLVNFYQAYRTLSNSTLRDEYDRIGVTSDDHDIFPFNTQAFVDTLLDCEKAASTFGELRVITFVDRIKDMIVLVSIHEGENVPDVMELNPHVKSGIESMLADIIVTGWGDYQRNRQIRIAETFLELIDGYVNELVSREDFEVACRAFAEAIGDSLFGHKFLSLIGDALVNEADEYRRPFSFFSWSSFYYCAWNIMISSFQVLTTHQSIINRIKANANANENEIKVSKKTLTDKLQSILPLYIDGMWSVMAYDIAETMNRVCWRLLSDTSVTSTTRRRRAKALLLLGRAMREVQDATCAVLKDRIAPAIKAATSAGSNLQNEAMNGSDLTDYQHTQTA